MVYIKFHIEAGEFYKDKHDGRILPHADRYTDCLVRLPLFYEVEEKKIIEIMGNYFTSCNELANARLLIINSE
ncbi:MAG: hypothetical protein BWY22_02449 [Bacteroidetes bacterium ADurb.Bin217]|nr:MAG: hypothetical protein BWY22_02449 [Bacteroidetes bacterium ADurb.Bin217]